MDMSNVNPELKDILDDALVSIKFDYEIRPRFGETDPGNYIQDFEGTIYTGKDDLHLNLVAGHIRATKVDIESAVNEGASLFEIFDDSAETAEFAFLLDDDEITERFCEEEFNFQPDYMFRPILILNYLAIKPEFRRKHIGLAAMKSTIEHIGVGCGLIALQAAPLQFIEKSDNLIQGLDTGNLELSKLDRDKNAATDKLIGYYRKLGFIRLDDTSSMIRIR